ncbi:MAG: biotin--[acetyl-CoA-carboxylase] ligase [Chloroflexia bacterium]|nr:biotin--[acetyl-CoA-carboxylase] ligase [Chloroflexia bacterium]
MSVAPPTWSIERHRRVGSTMEIAGERAGAGAPEGTVVVADYQSAGRGRAGRQWVAPPGSALMLTAVLRPDLPADRLGPLALVAGVALAEAVEIETGLSCWLKWPNDLWFGDRLDGRKTAGILVSARLGSAGVDHVLVGIGLNVSTPAGAMAPGATSIAVELAQEGREPAPWGNGTFGDDPRERFLSRTLERLGKHYSGFVAARGRPPLADWLERAALLGEWVDVDDGGEAQRGVFTGLRADGALLLRNECGDEVAVVAGDLVRGPRYRPPSASARSRR